MSGLSTRSPLLSPHAAGWRSNRLCVIKWWWWLYLTFVKGGAPHLCRSALSASIQCVTAQSERESENVVLGSKHRGYIEVNGNVFAESCVFDASRSFLCVCVRVPQLTCSRHVLRDPCRHLPHLPSGGGWLHTNRQTLSPWRSMKQHGYKEHAQNTSPLHAAACETARRTETDSRAETMRWNQLTVRIVP